MRYTAHLPYWVIIIALSGWLIFEKNSARGRELKSASIYTLQMAYEIMERDNQALFGEIERNVQAYISEVGIDYLNRSNRIRRLTSDFRDSMNHFAHGRLDIGALTLRLQKTVYAYQDSLILLTDNVPDIRGAFPNLMLQDSNIISQDWLVQHLKSARNDEIQLMLLNMLARSKGMETIALNYFASRSSWCGYNSRYNISIVSENLSPKVGDWYSADIYLSTIIQPNSPYLKIKVDGQALEVKDGIAHYRHRYTNPGIKKYMAEIKVTDPFTHRIESYMKEFSVMVVDSCR
jgi:hypothetical protein